MQRHSLTEGSISRGLLLFALPILYGNVLQTLNASVNAFWVATLKPLAELLRMRYCPTRWDFGVRYLDRDLTPAVYAQFRDLVFVRDLGELEEHLARATAWGATLLRELEPV